ncbi:B3 domain-containing protein At5g60130-like [Salvia hispanica]|uniref:B3 domain-containing protein At5g60130-like n=1 Tax=Salvia hispanica TaxID=49212 RepID=UPI00200950D1|nr:B3 domain-containing protein At5g60130-like [Salvia hispanica]
MIGGDWYFKDGWEKLAADNKIKGGDMFIYEYFSHGLLDFKIHGGNGCMTEGVGGRITRNIEEQPSIKIESDDGVVNHTDNAPIGEGHTHDNYVKEANHRDAHTVDEESRDDAPMELARDGTASSSKHIRRTYDWYGLELVNTGFIPPSPNPYFVTEKERNRGFTQLYIPMEVIKSFNLKLPENVTLLDPKGRQFSAKRMMWKDGRTFYTEGWRSLCEVNEVEEKDSCICEFLYNADDLCISVSFFPPK